MGPTLARMLSRAVAAALPVLLMAPLLLGAAGCTGTDDTADPGGTASTPPPSPTRFLRVPADLDDARLTCDRGRTFSDAPAYDPARANPLAVVGVSEVTQQRWFAVPIAELVLIACGTRIAGPKVDNCFYSGTAPVQDLVRGDVQFRILELRTGKEIGAVAAAGKDAPTCKTVLFGYEAKQEIQYGPVDPDRIFTALQPYFKK